MRILLSKKSEICPHSMREGCASIINSRGLRKELTTLNSSLPSLSELLIRVAI